MLFEASFEGPDLIQILKGISQKEPFLTSGKPDKLSVNGKKIAIVEENWKQKFIKLGAEDLMAEWGEYIEGTNFIPLDNSHAIMLDRSSCIKVAITDIPPKTIQEVLDIIGSIPWTLASFGTTYHKWNSAEKQDEGIGYLGPSLGNLHYNLGWACAFKGEGHKHLASKRILNYGPWRVIRDEANDITLVQFYDLNADAETALEQAKPGHELMGDYAHGALMTEDNPFYGKLNGIYQATKRKLEIVVAFRELPLTEIIDACKAKYAQSLGPDEPIDNVAFIFTASEQEARKYLFDIWLRGLECWAFIDGLPVRLDEDYTPPPPDKPEWVQQLEAQENNAAT
jgi:hypothetical protein